MPLRTDGAALRRRRLLKGLTIVEFAQQAEYSTNYVNQIELGGENAGPKFLRKAAHILGCEIEDLTDGVVPRRRSTSAAKAGAA